MVSKGNHPQMAQLFRLVKYYTQIICICGVYPIESTIIDDYVENSKGVFSLILCICWCHSPCWKLSFLAFAGFQPPLCCGCVRPYMIPSDNSTYGQLTDKKEQTLEVFLGHPEL